MKQTRKMKTMFSRLLSSLLVLTMVIPLLPLQPIETKAAVPGLVGTQSLVFNPGTIYNYSDSYGNRSIDLIDGKGDYNADTRAIAYAQNPDAQYWEGIYFGNGQNSTETHMKPIEPYEVTYNVAKSYSITDKSSGDGEIKDGLDGLWNNDTETKAWTTWTQGGNRSGYLTLTRGESFEADSFNEIKFYFLNTEKSSGSVFPTTITVRGRNGNNADWTNIETVNPNINQNNSSATFTMELDSAVSYQQIRFDFAYNNSKYIMLAEIELLGDKKETISEAEVSKDIANYNRWTGNEAWSGGNYGSKRAFIHSGLAKDTLVNGQIQFNVPEAGLFTQNTSNKEVYNNVNIPFIYDSLTGYYEFNAGPQNYGGYGYHFDLDYDGTITDQEKASGYITIDQEHFYAFDTINSNSGPNGEGIQGFFPFNAPQLAGERENDNDLFMSKGRNAVYHFGMQMSVNFTMSKTGTVDGTDSGDPITFEFAGDDDVWVYIDNQLVLDLGGIHDSVSGKIDFKENKITMWSTNTAYGSGDVNASSGIGGNTGAGYVTDLGQILNSEQGAGKIAKSYDAFSGEGNHTLTIFYLERGRSESNCKIKYNLPRVDSLEVRKDIQLGTKENEVFSPITDSEWDALNAIDFNMRVLKDDSPVVGKYDLYESSVYIGSYQTNTDGYFTLKNNQSARFTLPLGGNYVVEEVATPGDLPAAVWGTTTWSGVLTSTLAGSDPFTSTTVTNDDTEATDTHSYRFTVAGDEEAVETASIVCTNYVYRPFVSVASETVVIDYGLPVLIDIMANDVQSTGKEFVLNSVSGTKYGKVRVLDEDGNEVSAETYKSVAGYYYLEYTPTTYMSDIEKITYQYIVQDSSFDGGFAYPTAVATVIPATSMYYEENFLNSTGANYIRFSTATGYTGFETVGTAGKVYQEPGVVGTVTDSTYGTDVAYLTGTADSNGTSFKADTTNGPAAFQYTFTGTGTAFFARTSENSGYIKVTVKDANGTDVTGTVDKCIYIDTKYAVAGAELYNIPVFNMEGLEYGTYTVTAVVARPSQWYTAQDEFYLDGVRVYNPINLDDESVYQTVYDAYHKDQEFDSKVITLRDYMIDTQTDSVIDEETNTENIEWKENSQVMFTDSEERIVTASKYISDGPKQELYMTSGQSIRFVLKDWYADKPTDAKLYLGAKNPAGTNGTFTVNNTTYNIKNTTDCYYDITSAVTPIAGSLNGLVVVTVGSASGLISFTNLKCTEFAHFSLAGMDEDVETGGEGDAQTVQVFTLLRRTVSDDVPTDENTNTGESEGTVGGSTEDTKEDIENPDKEDEDDDVIPPIEYPDEEEETDKTSEILSGIITVAKQVVSVVKNLLSKLFGR